MEHKLKESNNMVSFRETSVSVAEANPILESKDTALITKEINCLKCFHVLKSI
jgi:tRNA uridine 5-carboxymethylaminomethyl modification enzyme